MQDPRGLLRGVEYKTRRAFEQLARSFEPATGWTFKVRSGRRTCAEQADIYAYGRTHHMDKEPQTYAQGCRSWHVLGRAIDADLVDPKGKMAPGCEPYAAAGALWEKMGGVWGGRFTGFGPCGDAGHFEWHPGLTMTQVCPDPAQCYAVEAAVQASTKAPTSPWTLALVGAGLVAIAVIVKPDLLR